VAALGQVLQLITEHAWSTPEGHAQLAALAPTLVAFGNAVDDADLTTGSVLVDGPAIVAAHDVLSHAITRLDNGEWTIADTAGHTAEAVARQLRADRGMLGPVPPPPMHPGRNVPPPGLGGLSVVPPPEGNPDRPAT